jgi:hypothetical protein
MKASSTKIPLLCEIRSRGLAPRALVENIYQRKRLVWPYAEQIVSGRGHDPFPRSTDGVTYRLGVIFDTSVRERWGGRWTYEKARKEMAVGAAGNRHPEVALYLREIFSQEELLEKVNSLHSWKWTFSKVVVMHEPIRDKDNHPTLLTLERVNNPALEGDLRLGDGLSAINIGPDYSGDTYAFVVLIP